MTVKDEYAGKTGKCPACGQKVTLPQPGDAADMRSEPAQTGAAAPAPSAAPADGGASKWKWIVVAAVLILAAGAAITYYLTAPSRIPIPGISLYNTPSDLYVQRSKALPTAVLKQWQQAVQKATGQYMSGKQLFFKLPNIDALWQQAVFSKSASDNYVRRMAAVPVHALRDWRTVLRRVSEKEVGPDPADTLIRIIDADRLFADGRFDTAVSDRLIARLNTLTAADVTRWADALAAEKGQAAVNLALVDAFFDNGTFNTKLFDKKLRSMR